jgi:hypothetical protein
MASSWWSSEFFIDKVASRRGWGLRRSVWSDTWTLSGAENDLEWTCVLTPESGYGSKKSESTINWVCPSLGWTDEQLEQHRSDASLFITETSKRLLTLDVTQLENITEESIRSAAAADFVFPPSLTVSWRGDEDESLTDIGPLIDCVTSLSLKPLFHVPEYLLHIDDSAGILDDDLRQRIENWPPAFTGGSDTQPFRHGRITLSREGLHIFTHDWWDSEAALEHQIQLGIDLAVRLHRAQTSYESARRVRLAKGGGLGQ